MNPSPTTDLLKSADYTTRYKQLIEQLRSFLGGSIENVNIWLNSPHPYLENRTPQSFIDEGKIEVVEYLAWAMETGQPW